MGGKLSNMFGKGEKSEETEDQANLRAYQEKLDGGGTVIGDEQDKRKVIWWQRLIYDKRFRIAYVFFLGVLLGIVIPVIIFATKLEKEPKPIYGSCLIKEYARFQCLINSAEPATEDMCVKALCCWENSNDLQFKCFHSFPSAYQYNVSSSRSYNIEPSTANSKQRAISPWTNLDLKSSHPDMMSPLRFLTHWESKEHLVVELFNAEVFPNRNGSTGTRNDIRKARNNGRQNEGGDDENLPFTISWGEDQSFFFIRVARRDTDETLFDTRLGPVYTTKKDITLSTLLPTKYFYGLKGGQGAGSLSTITYGVVNGFENSEFPFYISFEESGQWHGVLIDTTEPILVQVLQAPGLMLHLETDRPEINLHFFAGPTQPAILGQLHAYIRTKESISHPPMIPPYWGLGLHLCRKVENSSIAVEHIERLLQKGKSLVYDSDCIDEYLRHPIFLNEDQFAPNDTEHIVNLLEASSKRIMLSQKVTVLDTSVDLEILNDFLVLENNGTMDIPFLGHLGHETTVNYIDFFNAHFLQNEFPPEPLTETNITLPYHGFSLDDNFPKLDMSSERCPSPSTYLQSYFTTRLLTTSDVYLNVSSLWGSLCPIAALHNVTATPAQTGSGYRSHLSLHNVYGEQAMKTVHRTMTQRQRQVLLSSSSFWTGSMYYAAYNGMQAPFTWKGLQESVANTVRNYAMAPVSGTPICGGMLLNNITIQKSNELCLRWFQFGLLLPFARNSYDGLSSYGPLDLPDQFRGYLNDTIKTRYTYAPYYYRELLKYQETFVPLIRPMSFDFSGPQDRNGTLPLLSQFMIGDAIFAAPITDRGVRRSVYFPAGVWYAMDGQEAWTTIGNGGSKQITGLIHETPMFIRGSYMIPTLRDTTGLYSSIEETLQGKYALIAALSSSRTASGYLRVKEPETDNIHQVDFATTVNSTGTDITSITVNLNSTCGSTPPPKSDTSISTVIDQVRVYGLSYLGDLNVIVKSSLGSHEGRAGYSGEHNALRLYELKMDWCEASEYEVTVTKKEDA